jgi:tetratricopeptide (TPR) repeat protein
VAYPSLPEQRRREIAIIGTRLSLSAGQPLQAQRWAARSRHATGDDLHAHLELLELELTIPVLAPVEGPFAEVSAAIVTADWQAAYNAALRLDLRETAAVARALRVASHLIAEQAPDAALDILERVLDARPREPQVNWLIMRALADLGRYDDALNALTVLRALEAGPHAWAA